MSVIAIAHKTSFYCKSIKCEIKTNWVLKGAVENCNCTYYVLCGEIAFSKLLQNTQQSRFRNLSTTLQLNYLYAEKTQSCLVLSGIISVHWIFKSIHMYTYIIYWRTWLLCNCMQIYLLFWCPGLRHPRYSEINRAVLSMQIPAESFAIWLWY